MNRTFFAFCRVRGFVLAAVLLLLAAPPASASPEELAQRYPSGSFSSVEQADRAIAEVQAKRRGIEIVSARKGYYSE